MEGVVLTGERVILRLAVPRDVPSIADFYRRNRRSARLLQRLGFRVEGRAKEYLLIAGRWEDHVLTSRINRAWRRP